MQHSTEKHVSPIPVRIETGTGGGTGVNLVNGSQTAVGATAVQVAAANATRKGLLLQNVGAENVRVGATGVTATAGFRLAAGAMVVFTGSDVPTSAVFAIQEGATGSTVLAQEMT